MNSEMEFERTLRNLAVLAELKQNDKLITLSDSFAIHPPTPLRGAWRMWQGEARDANFQKIHDYIHTACNYVSTNKHTFEVVHPDLQQEQIKRRCLRMIETLKRSKNGISNLCHTYTDDTTSKVKLEIMMQQIDDFLGIYESSIVLQPPALAIRDGHGD